MTSGCDDPFVSLTRSVRRLLDVTIRTEVHSTVVAVAQSHVDAAVGLLSKDLMPGSFGIHRTRDGQTSMPGNVLIGERNPVAPPLVLHHEPDGSVWSEFTLGAAYEGPAGHVHGGVCALILDHVLGAPVHQPGKPAYTGTLTLRYVRGTPLGALRACASVDRTEGAKTFTVGHIADDQGITVHAEGVFIFPKKAGS